LVFRLYPAVQQLAAQALVFGPPIRVGLAGLGRLWRASTGCV